MRGTAGRSSWWPWTSGPSPRISWWTGSTRRPTGIWYRFKVAGPGFGTGGWRCAGVLLRLGRVGLSVHKQCVIRIVWLAFHGVQLPEDG